jgi:hypothetical protein
LLNVILEKAGDQLERSCEKWGSITQSQGGEECHTHNFKKANLIGHILRRNCILKQIIEWKIEEGLLATFHSNNGVAKAPQCYIIRTLSVLLFLPVILIFLFHIKNTLNPCQILNCLSGGGEDLSLLEYRLHRPWTSRQHALLQRGST